MWLRIGWAYKMLGLIGLCWRKGHQIAPYFAKVECFCFEEQKLLAGEEVDMPLLFFIDKDILDDPACANVDDMVLSYTFFRWAILRRFLIDVGPYTPSIVRDGTHEVTWNQTHLMMSYSLHRVSLSLSTVPRPRTVIKMQLLHPKSFLSTWCIISITLHGSNNIDSPGSFPSVVLIYHLLSRKSSAFAYNARDAVSW